MLRLPKILTIVGTRPEVIKLAPVIELLDQYLGSEHRICSTGQQVALLQETCNQLSIKPDYKLEVMVAGQTIDVTITKIIAELHPILRSFLPDWVIVHGDTTTCLAATLAAFYSQIKVAHIEAGLRSENLTNPFPEESIRVIVDQLASICFVPSLGAKQNLLKVGIDSSKILLSGNTGIDTLKQVLPKLDDFSPLSISAILLSKIAAGARLIVVTIHRSENRGENLISICHAIVTLANQLKDAELLVTLHPHPAIGIVIQRELSSIGNVHLVSPLPYLDFIWMLRKSYLILTDSGGLQEEAPYLGKPVLLLRDTTERQEVVTCHNVWMVGTDATLIVNAVYQLWNNTQLYQKMTQLNKPYGDGGASQLIVDYLLGKTKNKV